MNLYAMVGTGNGTPEAAALSARLAAWHDAMVAHERKMRAGRTGEMCDEECPHGEARMLWVEALEAFGDRAQGLTFLRSRATAASEPEERVASADVPSEAANLGRRSSGSGHKAVTPRSKLFVDSSERSRTAQAEL